MTQLLEGRKRDPRTERVLFALVANRALELGSKLAAARWVTRRAHIEGPVRDLRRRLLPSHGLADRHRR